MRIDYSIRLNAPKSQITLYTAVSILAEGGAGFITAEDDFTFKAGTRVEVLHPWVAEKRLKHTKLFEQNRLPGAVGAAALGKAFHLIWDAIQEGTRLQHAKKSASKDRKADEDSLGLF
jgi:hypothetical protein